LSEKFDALIIGAGLSGLSAGISLQVSGYDALIVEKHTLPGGLNSFYKRGGYLFSSGLHAMTGYHPGKQDAHLSLASKFLEIPLEDFHLAGPRTGSLINTPYAKIEFGNDLEIMIESLRKAYPLEIDSFLRFIDYGNRNINADEHIPLSARAKLREFFSEELAEVLLFPIMFYAGYKPGDIDFYTYWNVFKSLFLDGICVPADGMREMLKVLGKKFKDSGGEIRYGKGVERIVIQDGRASGVLMEDGVFIEADQIFSCAGLEETQALIHKEKNRPCREQANISVFETVFITEKPVRELGYPYAISFNALTDSLEYGLFGLANTDSFLIACMDNYNVDPVSDYGMLKVCSIADYRSWKGVESENYAQKKEELAAIMKSKAERIIPGVSAAIQYTTTFSPLTIERYTGHFEGSVYGAPHFSNDGTVNGAENVFIVGNDQGSVGISGALLSGVFMTVKHTL